MSGPAGRRPGVGAELRYLAHKCPEEEGPDAAQRKRDMEERKSALVSALAAKVWPLSWTLNHECGQPFGEVQRLSVL